MGGSAKGALGAVLPIIALAAVAAVPALAPFSALIVGGAGLVGSFLGQQDLGIGEWERQATDADIIKGNNRTTQRTVPVLYGKRKVGSNDVFMEMAGTGRDRRLWIVSCLCEGETEGIEVIDGVPQIYVDDQLVSEFNEEHEDLEPDPIVEYFFVNGSGNQPVEPNINAAIEKFTDPMRDTSYIVWKIIYKTTIFIGIPKRQAVVKGRKALDPRSGTFVYSTNPAVQLYDYMVNDRFGMAISPASINTASVIASANYCDDASYKAAWVTNYAVASQIKSQTIIDTLLAHYRGSLKWFNGEISFDFADLRVETPVLSIDDSFIERKETGEDSVYVSQPSLSSTPDGVLVKYISEQKRWTQDDVYIGETTGQIKQLEFPGFIARDLALEMGVYMLERERLNRSFSFTTRPNTIVLDPGDIITVTSSELFLDGKECRVTQSEILPNGLVRINLVVEQESLYNAIYDPDPEEAYRLEIASPVEPPPSIQNVQLQEQIYAYRDRTFVRAKILFDAPEETSEGLAYPWWSHADIYTSSNGINWGFRFSAVDDFIIDPVEEGDLHLRAASVSTTGARQAPEDGFQTVFAIQGVKGVRPPSFDFSVSVSGDTITFTPIGRVDNPDIAGYEVRIGNAWTSNTWKDATFMASGLTPSFTFTNLKGYPANGTYDSYYFMAAVGTNGLYGPSRRKGPYPISSPKPGFVDLEVEPYIILNYSTGTHNDTTGSGGKLRTTGSNLSGYWDSISYDMDPYAPTDEDETLIAALRTGWAVIGETNTWADLAPGSQSWNDLSPPSNPQTWATLTGNEGPAPGVDISLLHSESSSSGFTEISSGLEKFDGSFYKRYIRFRISITNPSSAVKTNVGPGEVFIYERYKAPDPPPPPPP